MGVADGIVPDPGFVERYELGEKLGQGGMGSVYRGVQKVLGRPVAIKFLAADLSLDPEFLRRFLTEAKLAAEIIHQNVVVVFDSGIAGGRPYLVTELVEGDSLAAILARGRLRPREVLAIARQLSDGLEAIHARSIVHRDLKPANVLVTRNGACVKITDFGIAKQNRPAPEGVTAAPRTATGIVMGTPEYMAPEQIVGDTLSPATDLYALALMLHRMIAGSHPFAAPSLLEIFHKQVHEEPRFAPGLAPSVRALLSKGLAKLPRDRFSSAGEFRDALGGLAREFEESPSFDSGRPTGSAFDPQVSETVSTPRPAGAGKEASLAPESTGSARTEASDARSVCAGVSGAQSSEAAPEPFDAKRFRGLALMILIAATLMVVAGLFTVRSLARVEPPRGREDPLPGPVSPPSPEGGPVRSGGYSWITLENDCVPRMVRTVTGMRSDRDPSSRLIKGEAATKVTTLEEDLWAAEVKLDHLPATSMGSSGNFEHRPGGLQADAPAEPALFIPFFAMKARGTIEVHYRAERDKGAIDLDLVSTSSHDPALVYRLRLDLARREWLCLVTDVSRAARSEDHREMTRFHSEPDVYYLFEWKPDPWKLIDRQPARALHPGTTVSFTLDGSIITVTVAGAARTLRLYAPFEARRGPLWPRIIAAPKTRATIDRLVLTGQFVFDQP